MQETKMALAVLLSICLLTACGQAMDTKSPDISTAFEETESHISQETVDAMADYEAFIDAYCEYMDVWFKLGITAQAQQIETYAEFNEKLAQIQGVMEDILSRKDEFTKEDYAYIQQTNIRCAQKLLECASNGLQTAGEILNG